MTATVPNPSWGDDSSDRLGYDGASRMITKRYLAGGIDGGTGAYSDPTSIVGFTLSLHLFWGTKNRLKKLAVQRSNDRREAVVQTDFTSGAHRSRHANFRNDLSLRPPVSRRLPVVVLEQPAQPHPALDRAFRRR